MSEIEYCILTDEKDIIEYEKKLYESFTKKDPDGWVVNNYELIDGCRLRSKTIPIENQVFCVAKKESTIIAGMSGNLKCEGKLQLEEMGFKIKRDEGKFCEGLTLYNANEMSDKLIYIFDKLMNIITENLKRMKIYTIYATCSDLLVNMYNLFGFEMIDIKNVSGIKKYLMKYNIL